MTIVACPRCRDEVQLPTRVSPQARVRCPLCRDEYILSEALAKMPPTLIVLDPGPGLDEAGGDEPEYKLAGSGEGLMAGSAMAGAFDSSPALGESPVSAAPRPIKTGAKPRRKSGGGALGQIIQIVLGGVGAIILFQPLAWYVMKQDPFMVGPIVAKYVPGIVPEQFQGKRSSSSSKSNNDGALAANNTSSPPPVPAVVQNKSGNFDPGEKFKGLSDTNPQANGDPILDDGPIPEIPPEPEMQPDIKTPDLKPEVKLDDPLNEPPSRFTPPMPMERDPNQPPEVSATAVTLAYGAALGKRQDFEASVAAGDEASVRFQKGKELYEAAAELGKLLADADLTDPDIEDKASLVKDELTMKMTSNGKRLTMLAVFADPSLAEDSNVEGIAVGGIIKDIKPLGATHETTIEVTRQNGTLFTLPIVTTKSLEDEGAKVGDTLIVLGKIVRAPKKDLPTYKGEAPQVIKAGHTTVVSAQ
jgi:hypothetical protein